MSYFGDDAEFRHLVTASRSPSNLVRLLGRAVGGHNVTMVIREVVRLGLDVTHWRRKGESPGKLTSSQVLVAGGTHSTDRVKRIILRERLLSYVCAICGLGPQWNGQPLVLRLDHRNGVRNDHRLENLRFLCPNCDAQTSTYCGGNRRIHGGYKQCACGAKIRCASTTCKSCAVKARKQPTKATWPPVEELRARVAATSFLAVAKELGVSDNAVRKHLRARHLAADGS